MSNPNFDSSELMSMRSFYEAELHNTLNKLYHIQSVLHKLNGAPAATIPVLKTGAKRGRKPKVASVEAIANRMSDKPKASGTITKKKSSRKGKPGRRSIWGNYILQHLSKVDKPLTYDELFTAAKKDNNIANNPVKEKSVHQAVINASHRLRNTNKAIDTFALKGSRIKYVALKDWFEKDGSVKPEYFSKVS